MLHKHSKLVVEEARPEGELLTNRIYYAPAKFDIAVKGDQFDLIPRGSGDHSYCIDTCLHSIAQSENAKKTVAILLSGKGNDGVKGASVLKRAGGLIIVQSPGSTSFPELPKNVIDAGLADFVLDPDDIPVILQGYVNRLEQNNRQKA